MWLLMLLLLRMVRIMRNQDEDDKLDDVDVDDTVLDELVHKPEVEFEVVEAASGVEVEVAVAVVAASDLHPPPLSSFSPFHVDPLLDNLGPYKGNVRHVRQLFVLVHLPLLPVVLTTLHCRRHVHATPKRWVNEF